MKAKQLVKKKKKKKPLKYKNKRDQNYELTSTWY